MTYIVLEIDLIARPRLSDPKRTGLWRRASLGFQINWILVRVVVNFELQLILIMKQLAAWLRNEMISLQSSKSFDVKKIQHLSSVLTTIFNQDIRIFLVEAQFAATRNKLYQCCSPSWALMPKPETFAKMKNFSIPGLRIYRDDILQQ